MLSIDLPVHLQEALLFGSDTEIVRQNPQKRGKNKGKRAFPARLALGDFQPPLPPFSARQALFRPPSVKK